MSSMILEVVVLIVLFLLLLLYNLKEQSTFIVIYDIMYAFLTTLLSVLLSFL